MGPTAVFRFSFCWERGGRTRARSAHPTPCPHTRSDLPWTRLPAPAPAVGGTTLRCEGWRAQVNSQRAPMGRGARSARREGARGLPAHAARMRVAPARGWSGSARPHGVCVRDARRAVAARKPLPPKRETPPHTHSPLNLCPSSPKKTRPGPQPRPLPAAPAPPHAPAAAAPAGRLIPGRFPTRPPGGGAPGGRPGGHHLPASSPSVTAPHHSDPRRGRPVCGRGRGRGRPGRGWGSQSLL